MGNYNLKPSYYPQNGEIVRIIETPLTSQYPKEIMGYGSKVKVLYTSELACSRNDSPKIYCTLGELPSGYREVFITNSLAKI